VHSGCYFFAVELNGNWLRPLSGMHCLMSFGHVLIAFEIESLFLTSRCRIQGYANHCNGPTSHKQVEQSLLREQTVH